MFGRDGQRQTGEGERAEEGKEKGAKDTFQQKEKAGGKCDDHFKGIFNYVSLYIYFLVRICSFD